VVESTGMRVEVAMDVRLQAAAEAAVQEDLRAVDKRQGWRGPELKLDPDKLDAVRTAMSKKLSTVSQPDGSASVVIWRPSSAAALRKAVGAKKKSDDDTDGRRGARVGRRTRWAPKPCPRGPGAAAAGQRDLFGHRHQRRPAGRGSSSWRRASPAACPSAAWSGRGPSLPSG